MTELDHSDAAQGLIDIGHHVLPQNALYLPPF